MCMCVCIEVYMNMCEGLHTCGCVCRNLCVYVVASMCGMCVRMSASVNMGSMCASSSG